jgi:DNA-binding MarR family transcriptional regulator
MPKLTDTQLVILSAAAKRKDGAVLPPPKSLKVKGGALTGTLKSLLKKGLVEEQPAKGTARAWREAEDGSRLSLMITAR